MTDLLLGLILLALSASADGGSLQRPSFYFIGGEDTGRWCAFRDLSAARSMEAKLQSGERFVYYDMGSVYLDGSGAIAELTISAGPESGDWVLADRYRLSGTIPISVRREVNYADGSPTLVQTFERRNGHLRRTSSQGGGMQPVEQPYGDFSDMPLYRFLTLTAKSRGELPTGFCRPAPRRDKAAPAR